MWGDSIFGTQMRNLFEICTELISDNLNKKFECFFRISKLKKITTQFSWDFISTASAHLERKFKSLLAYQKIDQNMAQN